MKQNAKPKSCKSKPPVRKASQAAGDKPSSAKTKKFTRRKFQLGKFIYESETKEERHGNAPQVIDWKAMLKPIIVLVAFARKLFALDQ